MDNILALIVVLVIAATIIGSVVAVVRYTRSRAKQRKENLQRRKDSLSTTSSTGVKIDASGNLGIGNRIINASHSTPKTTYTVDRWQPQTRRDDSDDGLLTGMLVGAAINSIMHSSSSSSSSDSSSSSSWGLDDSDSRSSISSSMDTSSSWDSSDSGPSSDW